MKIIAMMNRMPRAIFTILNLSAAAAMNSEIFHRPRRSTDLNPDKTGQEVIDPKLHEFEHEPVEGLRPLLKRSRVLSDEACKQTKETKGTDIGQEGTEKNRRIISSISTEKLEDLNQKDKKKFKKLVKKLEKLYNEIEVTEDEKATEVITQEIKKENPDLAERQGCFEQELPYEFRRQCKNNLNDAEKDIIQVRNDLAKALHDSYANWDMAKENARKFLKNKKTEKKKKADKRMSEWLKTVSSTPFDIAEKDNSGPYLLDYETLCFFVKFLSADPEFTRLFEDTHYNSEEQPCLWIFEWILQIDSASHDLLNEKIKLHSKSFTSYSEMMKFVVEKVFKEDSRFVDVLRYKIEIISCLEVQSKSECHVSGVEQPEQSKSNENIVSEETGVEPKFSLQPPFESKCLENQTFSECFNKQRMVTLHELIGGYEDSKLTIRACRNEFSEVKRNNHTLKFQSIWTGMADIVAVERKIRAIAFNSKNNEGKNMLNFITMEALNTYEKKKPILKKLIKCAVYILYEDKDTSGYGRVKEIESYPETPMVIKQ